MLHQLRLGTLALAIGLLAAKASVADSPQTNVPATIKPRMPKELADQICLSDFREDRLIPLLKALEEKKQVKIALDQTGIESACKKSLEKIEIDVPRSSLPMAVGLEIVAKQVHGTLISESGRWRIGPGTGDLTRFLSPPSLKAREKHLRSGTLEKAILNMPGQDVFDFLAERYEVAIALSPHSLDQAMNGRWGLRECTLTPAKKPLLVWINETANQMNAQVQEFDELILIVPRVAKRP
jgi:hypothetical protein